MTWIKTIPIRHGDDTLREAFRKQGALYPPEYSTEVELLRSVAPRETGQNITASHSLIPEALHYAFGTFGALMSAELPLTRLQHEMIATVVSVQNRCYYCTESHVEFLRRVGGSEELLAALRRDYKTAPVSPADAAILHYAARVTLASTTLGEEDTQVLRDHGFSDRGILQITLIAAWFNYINRVANSLGVGRSGASITQKATEETGT